MVEEVRVRFAPSPTGHLHIGNVRTAILNWIFARHSGGKFILRIEDTDVARSSKEYETLILKNLSWLGITWDEGPDIGGPFAPYRQSQRLHLYREYADKLLETGKAYHCFCTAEELEQAHVTEGAVQYNRRCLNLSEEEKNRLRASGRQPAIRFKVPSEEIHFDDLIKGPISFPGDIIGDFVILRNDGTPTYNFSAVVDDHLMNISHVIRGDDHVSNTPKQILIYRALNREVPQFAHIPMILGPDRERLAKLHGATSLDQFREAGYLPEALINFLSLLGWSSETGDEILSIERLVKEFDFKRVSKAAAIFDLEKLDWMNGYYLRNCDLSQIAQLAIPYLQQAGYPTTDFEKIKKIISIIRDKIKNLSQVAALSAIFFQEKVTFTDSETRNLIRKDSSQKVYWSFLRELKNIEYMDSETFRKIMQSVQKETGVIGKDLWLPIRVALTGETQGPDLPAVAEILGKEKCHRFVSAIVEEYKY